RQSGMLLLVIVLLAASFTSTNAQTATAPDSGPPSPPAVNASNIVVLSDFNEVLYEQNAHERIPMASLTKLMTAIVVVEYADLNSTITIREDDLVGEATMGLLAGDDVTVGDLLYGLLLPSGNDAAMALARGVGAQLSGTSGEKARQVFYQYMNQMADYFQLRNTHFKNSHGLDEDGHYSSAYDVAILLRAALNYPEIRERMTTRAIRVGDRFDLYNGNQLLTDRSDYIGGKTGLTDGAGFCLAGAARQDGRMVIAVAMQDDWSWFWDVNLLLDYGFDLIDYNGVPDWAPESLIGTQLEQPRNGSNIIHAAASAD
ncbi:MAG: D-alanyl-D-alanine carboxypeptidase family protein, partial [Chloroflexota bacterium]